MIAVDIVVWIDMLVVCNGNAIGSGGFHTDATIRD
jgi:hypothetical protein